MSTKHLLAKEIQTLPDLMPAISFDAEMLPAIRQMMADGNVMGDAEQANVSREEIHIEQEGASPVRCLVYTPLAASNNDSSLRSGYLHLHGGGYIIGTPEGSDMMNLATCARLGIVIVSVDYRLAPEHPIPAPLDDSHTALAWLHENARRLKVDASKIGVGGESAGGGLAAALAIKARDEGKYSICHQHLTYPMLDNRTGTDEMPADPLVGEFVWTRASNKFGWASYLGTAHAEAPQVPAKVSEFSGLPPAWIFTGGLDLFRDENIEYAQNLLRAGIAAELLVYPDVCHAFQRIADAKVSKRFNVDFISALARGLGLTIS